MRVLLLAVALLGLPCNRKSYGYGLFLRTAGLEFGLDVLPNRFFAVPLLQWHVKPPLPALWPEFPQTTAGAKRCSPTGRTLSPTGSSPCDGRHDLVRATYHPFRVGRIPTSWAWPHRPTRSGR